MNLIRDAETHANEYADVIANLKHAFQIPLASRVYVQIVCPKLGIFSASSVKR